MIPALIAYLCFGIVGGAAWVWMIVRVNRLQVIPHISIWKRSLRQFEAMALYRKHFPESLLFTVFLTCTLIAVLFFGLYIYDSESTRTSPGAQYSQH